MQKIKLDYIAEKHVKSKKFLTFGFNDLIKAVESLSLVISVTKNIRN